MIQHSVHDSDNRVVLGDECRRLGIGDFCARMVCQINSSSNGRKGALEVPVRSFHQAWGPLLGDPVRAF
jgi:hypothetical protein